VFYDHDENSSPETITLAADGTKFTSGRPMELRFKPKQQKCSAMKLTISDNAGTGLGENYSLSDLAFVIGVKPKKTLGPNKTL
jgi:hypothetical protein